MKWKSEFQKKPFIFQIWLLNWKTKNEKKFFLLSFDFCFLKLVLNQNKFKKKFEIFQFIFWFEIKKWISKKFFHFSIFVLKLKNEKWKIFKILFVFKPKKQIVLSVHELFLFSFSLLFSFSFLFLFSIFLVFIFKFYYGTSRPLYTTT